MRRRAVALALACTLCPAAQAGIIPPAYLEVALAYGIPPEVLYAVALTESAVLLTTGRRRPWPWTLNVEGRPEYYRTRVETWEAIQRHLADGRISIDIGLMQVNWRYHADALGNPWVALDPGHNLRVGASILRGHFDACGDWLEAAGRYHSPGNPQRAARYRARVEQQLALLPGAESRPTGGRKDS